MIPAGGWTVWAFMVPSRMYSPSRVLPWTTFGSCACTVPQPHKRTSSSSSGGGGGSTTTIKESRYSLIYSRAWHTQSALTNGPATLSTIVYGPTGSDATARTISLLMSQSLRPHPPSMNDENMLHCSGAPVLPRQPRTTMNSPPQSSSKCSGQIRTVRARKRRVFHNGAAPRAVVLMPKA